MNNGWIKLHKKFIESPLWKYSIQTKMYHLISLWMFLLMNANWEEKKWYDGKQEVIIPKGSFITSINVLADATSISPQQTRTALKHFEKMKMITHRTTNRWTHVWIVNWAKYQGGYDSDNTQDNKPITNGKQTDNKRITTTKEYKNIRNKEEILANYLLNIPDTDLEEFTTKFTCNRTQVLTKAEQLFNWCKSKGKTYKDYKAFLRNALSKDYGHRVPSVNAMDIIRQKQAEYEAEIRGMAQ